MTRQLILLAALILYVASPVAQAFATSHVRPPDKALVQPTPADTERTSGMDTENSPGTFGTFLSDNHETFRTYGLIIGGVAGLIFAFWRAKIATRLAEAAAERADAAIDQARAANDQARAANEQARIAEQGHITDRFSRAVEHLGSAQLPVRLGGIYALWHLIKDSPERVISVIDILCAFVRDPPHPPVDRPEPDIHEDGPAAAEDEANATGKLRTDVQAILKLIGNENAVYRALLPAGYRLDFTGAKLGGTDLMHANLARAGLTDADLTVANLTGANLTDAVLRFANLLGAVLAKANLTNADLTGANLAGAELPEATLTGANLTGANLTRADFTDAQNLTQDQLDTAHIIEGGEAPALPDGLNPPQRTQWTSTR